MICICLFLLFGQFPVYALYKYNQCDVNLQILYITEPEHYKGLFLPRDQGKTFSSPCYNSIKGSHPSLTCVSCDIMVRLVSYCAP